MHSQQEFTIAELEEATGQSRRSIHHYISRGLLPNAEGSGPAARYGREHYLRLRLIDYASQAGFKIDKKLQAALDRMSSDEMEQVVERAEGSSAEDIRSFGHWLLTGDPKASTAPPVPRRRTAQSELFADDVPFLASMTSDRRPMVRHALADRMPSTAEFLRRAGRPATRADPEPWERLRLGDDVELAWRPRYDARFIERLRRLLQVAHELFGDEQARRSGDEDERDV